MRAGTFEWGTPALVRQLEQMVAQGRPVLAVTVEDYVP
jgi:hypothetical protein